MSDILESRQSYGELFDWDQRRVQRIVTRRVRREASGDARAILDNQEAMDELCSRLFDDAPVFGKLTEFIDWLIGLDWERIAQIIQIIITLFA